MKKLIKTKILRSPVANPCGFENSEFSMGTTRRLHEMSVFSCYWDGVAYKVHWVRKQWPS